MADSIAFVAVTFGPLFALFVWNEARIMRDRRRLLAERDAMLSGCRTFGRR